MIKHIYAFKNILSSNFGDPVLQVLDQEQAVEAYSIAAKEAQGEAKARMAELDLYYLGTFDTKTAEMKLESPTFLVSLKEVLSDGKESIN